MALIEHLEGFLGPIEEGWKRDWQGRELAFQIVRFARSSRDGTVAFSTIGLSRQALRSDSGKTIRQELLMIVPDSLQEGPFPGLLQQVGSEVLAQGRPLLRGDVLGPRGDLFTGSNLRAIYVAMPVYLPDEFATARIVGGDVVIAWLVPIGSGEAAFILHHGWSSFEDELVRRDPELTDVYRQPLQIG
jgi:hypothetical protein